MAASSKHILTNVERLASDDELLKLWNDIAQSKNDDGTERTPQEAWTLFVHAADAARIADRIPGSVGRSYKSKYAAEAPTAVEVNGTKVAETRKATAKAPAKRTTARSAKKAAGK